MSPVARIKGAATLLKSGTLSPEDAERMLDVILVSSDNLNQVLDSFYIKTKKDLES
jgi:nitrogen-specific signal transduction histidine kinase